MNPATQILLSSMLTFGSALAFAGYELIALRRDGRRPPNGDRRPEPPPSPKPLPAMPIRKPLPACLIPVLPPRPVRTDAERELV